MNFLNSQQHSQNQFQQQLSQLQYDQICQQHGQQITHMCCLENCLTPLCGKCIKEHTLYHKQDNIFAEIETIDDIDQFCEQKLSQSKQNYSKELEELQQQLYQQGKQPQERYQQLENVKAFRKKLINQINIYFDDLERSYNNIEQQISIQQTLKQHENQLKLQIQKLQNVQDNFGNKQNQQKMQLIKQILTADYEETLNFYQSQKPNYLEQYKKENYQKDLYLDQHPKERLQEFLKQLAFFKQMDKLPQYYKSYNNSPDKNENNNNNFDNVNKMNQGNNLIKPNQKDQKDPVSIPFSNINLQDKQKDLTHENKQVQPVQTTQYSPEPIINTDQTNLQYESPYLTPEYRQLSQQPTFNQFNNTNNNNQNNTILDAGEQNIQQFNKNQIKNFQITMPDYFNSVNSQHRCFMHFFQHKSKTLHLVNLQDLHKGLNPKFYQLELKISFKIPRWHKSFTLPDGNIVLTGGVSCEVKDKKLNNSYMLDFNTPTLKPIQSMNLARSGHAMTYLKGELYVIGGFSELQTFTTRCEKYNFKENKWTDIAELNQRANNPCVCSFNDQYIFKFGGKFDDFILNKLLERYDPVTNKWEIIKFQSSISPSLTLLTSSSCCQINEKQIIVFGGTFENYSQKSDSCYLLDIQNSQQILDQFDYSIIGFGEKNLPAKDGFWNNQCIIYDNNLFSLQNISNDDSNSVVYLDRRRILKFNSHFWTSLNDYQIKGSIQSNQQQEYYDTPQQHQQTFKQQDNQDYQNNYQNQYKSQLNNNINNNFNSEYKLQVDRYKSQIQQNNYNFNN